MHDKLQAFTVPRGWENLIGQIHHCDDSDPLKWKFNVFHIHPEENSWADYLLDERMQLPNIKWFHPRFDASGEYEKEFDLCNPELQIAIEFRCFLNLATKYMDDDEDLDIDHEQSILTNGELWTAIEGHSMFDEPSRRLNFMPIPCYGATVVFPEWLAGQPPNQALLSTDDQTMLLPYYKRAVEAIGPLIRSF